MKEEELLSKEELARIKIKASKWGLLGFGVFIGIFVIVLAHTTFTGDVSLYRLTIIFFGAALICCIIAELKCGRNYQDKLKELKKSGKGE